MHRGTEIQGNSSQTKSLKPAHYKYRYFSIPAIMNIQTDITRRHSAQHDFIKNNGAAA